jgi:hypothetical protein
MMTKKKFVLREQIAWWKPGLTAVQISAVQLVKSLVHYLFVFPFSFARSSLVAGSVCLKACVFIGLAVHALIYILLIFKFDLYRGACGGGRYITHINLSQLE